MAQERWDEMGIDEAKAARTIPIGRVTEPHEVAELAFYLASAAAGSVTGQAMTIDGGILA